MPLLDAHIVPFLVAIFVIAVLLGLLANVLAVRLLLDLDRAANEPVYRRSFRTRRPRHAQQPRAHLYLVS